LNTKIQTFQVWLEEFKLEEFEFKTIFPHSALAKKKRRWGVGVPI
jgi:hypothetical protein